jgi:iron complex transport system ATP-binding protein
VTGPETTDRPRPAADVANGAAVDGDSALLAEALAVGYPETETPVVTCPRLDVPDGEITALIGPNGSGKSTLLKALSAHLSPEDGQVLLHGNRLQTYDQSALARELGILSQERSAPTSLTVEELAYHGRYPHRGFLEAVGEDDHQAVDRALGLAGIEHLREEPLDQLSGGQKQLAWIAMVLAQETDVLLLDEPTTFLDMHHQLRVLETIRSLNDEAGVTVGVVLHDVAQAARFADYLVAMDDGSLYDWGPPEEVVTEELLADVFAVEATVTHDPDVRIVPRRALD